MITPAYSEAQRIGNLGKRYFVGNHPDSWQEESEPKQGGDFGFDLSMWLEKLGSLRGRFSVQLKSTVGLKIRGADKEPYASVPLTREVCNLYIQDGQPVMLVLIALEDGNSAKSGQMFYIWIDNEIQKRLGSRVEFDDTDPAEMTFRIPIKNELTRNVDISDYLMEYWSHTRLSNLLRTDAGTAALKAVTALSPKAVLRLSKITSNSLDKWLVNDALDGDSLWATPKSGSLISKIKQISDFISHGNGTDADPIIAEIDASKLDDAEIRAELYFQEGRRAVLRGDTEAAHTKFCNAAELQENSARYFCAELETAVLVNIGKTPVVPQDLSDRVKVFRDDPDVKFQMVRIKAMEGDFVEAERLLAELEGSNKRKPCVHYYAISKDWSGALEAAEKGLAKETDSKQRRFLTVLHMRALLNIVTGDADEVSIGGRTDLDIADARRLLDSTVAALREAKSAGWPANSEMLLDCASVSCVVLGPNDDLLELVSDYASRHQDDEYTQESLARIATLAGEQDIAVAALKRMSILDPRNEARLVLLLGESNKHQECVDRALGKLIDLPHDELIDFAMVVATLSANKLGSILEESSLRNYVSQGSFASKALLRFLEGKLKHPEDRSQHLNTLWSDAMDGTGEDILQDNLFLYLRPDRNEDVDRLLALGDRVQQRRGLTMFESGKYAAALLNKERHEDALHFTERAIKFYPDDENIGLVRAVALDRTGQSAAAEAVLRQFKGSSRKDLLQAHSHLLLRVGEVDTALALVKNALANANNQKDRFHFQRTLSVLYGKIDPDQYIESVWRLGEIADRAVEEQEGVFLALFASASMVSATQIDHTRILEFQGRIEDFSELFPSSSFFRVGKLPDSDAGEDFIAGLHKMLGIDEKSIKEHQRLRNIGERRGSLIPLALRPRGAAPYVSNVIDLLSVSIAGTYEDESSKIVVADSVLTPSEFKAPPIIDFPTIVALVELDIFDHLFYVWTAIAVPKISLQILSELSFERLTTRSSAIVERVTEAIRRHRSEIVQPGTQIEDGPLFQRSEHKTISRMVAAGEFDFLSVDISSAVIVESETRTSGRCHSLWDFMRVATHKGVIGTMEARVVRLRLASWNTVGVPLEPEDVALAARGAMLGDRSINDGRAASRAARRFVTEAFGGESVQRAAQVIVEISISGEAACEESIRWFAMICYREFVLAGPARFTQSADGLTAHLLALVAVHLHGRADGIALMQAVWRVINGVRVEFGGNEDLTPLLRSLGELAANLFDKIIKGSGSVDMSTESSYRELMFSGVTPGTHDRDVVEGAYFKRTADIKHTSDGNR